MKERILYHGSKEIVECPEISFHSAKALTTLQFLKGSKVIDEE